METRILSSIFGVWVVTLLLVPFVGGTFCWECTSLDHDWCSEYFNVDLDMTPYLGHQVNCTGAKRHCMKLIAHMKDDRVFYVRTCDVSQISPGTCMTASHVLSIPRSTVCVCDGQMCNMTSQLSVHWWCLWILVVVLACRNHLWGFGIR